MKASGDSGMSLMEPYFGHRQLPNGPQHKMISHLAVSRVGQTTAAPSWRFAIRLL
jgi:hypothetical protein